MKVVVQNKDIGDTIAINGVDYVVLNSRKINDKMIELTLSDVGADSPELAESIAKANKLLNLTAEYNGHIFSADDESQSRMHRTIRLMELNSIDTVTWKVKGGTTEVTKSDLEGILLAGMTAIAREIMPRN